MPTPTPPSGPWDWARLIPLGPFALGLFAFCLGLFLFKKRRGDARTTRTLQATQLLNEAADLLGGEDGTTSTATDSVKDRRQRELASRKIKQALALTPRLSRAHSLKAVLLSEQWKLDESIASSLYAIKLAPDNVSAHTCLGNALSEQGQLDEAIDAYNKAAELDPASSSVYNNLGQAILKQGRLDEAIAVFRKSTELDPDNAVSHSNLERAQQALSKRNTP